MIYHVTVGERTFAVEFGPHGVSVDGRPVDTDFGRIEGGPIRSLLVDGASHRIAARRVGKETWDLHLRGRRMRADVVDERTRVIREMTGSSGASLGPRPIVAPMPGLVVRVEVAPGDIVRAGQGLIIVEAMKMENELKAEADGVVTRVHVAEGQAVEKDQLLIDLAPLEETGD
ncbi:MAG: biotin/lipoyl-binding protein [Gemmatimonadetes bacterium]|nr:biotin/lipoyl-binding protein [Gemmatimonadota bacterium]MDA1104710.1 biotin/lipoyl-binding protein [Gemmatimonadota bacterium]